MSLPFFHLHILRVRQYQPNKNVTPHQEFPSPKLRVHAVQAVQAVLPGCP
ncbi:hypothetical protein PHYBLDRAFT_147023 [Phycomyces blakesleeanus NRRL 1555(-)]|uniref:Uncharacterized protein n=1 Tax=Phycomyces blakesleeanus (strain ATCC 8743b / DSM 1359 / FGSC 10004 / NBRC 33097 / NRRL 1555) TaxID=763407 RepID=A0A162X1R9_PHYB8|nr:hypothetical protein PHYBLDRAFT_147023 [Phycomyces blakesleeanus NRRL 1555(-)]OAD72045.1 hypothetical protein PHYBLDRAFT_147023 [Phycomyces blakesleeanus NRRL 1555(-)]|eukprot:XP_018290085.1 hypothetical protein PHYBLDRAFT_147023 [Phycomyces blakesleeanus NRRL 1555(-)]